MPFSSEAPALRRIPGEGPRPVIRPLHRKGHSLPGAMLVLTVLALMSLWAAEWGSLYAWAGASTPKPLSVDMRSFGTWEPERAERLDFSVWYPGRGQTQEKVLDGWIVSAGRPGRVIPGLYPVVLLSHDSAGSRFANNDLAASLAGAGMIVIVPAHAGDNQQNSDRIHTAAILRDRPRHLLKALEAVLNAEEFAPYADASRIGLIGVGFGAFTVLQLAGVAPDFTVLDEYCGQYDGIDAFCSPWTRQRLARIPSAVGKLQKERSKDILCPSLDLYAVEQASGSVPAMPVEGRQPGPVQPGAAQSAPSAFKTQDAHSAGVGSAQGAASPGNLPEKADITPVPAPSQARRVRAIALLVPAGGMFFLQESLRAVQAPVAVVAAGKDRLYPPGRHARPYIAEPSAESLFLEVEQADHFSLFAGCSEAVYSNLDLACGRASGDEREQMAKKRDGFLVPFFQSTLGGPLAVDDSPNDASSAEKEP